MENILCNQKSIINRFIAELRDVNIQKDSMRFRRNMERIGEIFAYEISKTLNYEKEEITTPLGVSKMNIPKSSIVIASVLRAGLPFHNGFLHFFDNAENAFITASRQYTDKTSFSIKFDNISSPSLDNKTLILADPMLASGASMKIAYEELLKIGTPAHTHMVTIIASTQGIKYIKDNLDLQKISIWAGDVDHELSSKSYIVPGIGDAGDLAFGPKI